MYIPELKKNVSSSSPGQEDFPAEQVTFKAFLPGPGKSCSKKIINSDELEVASESKINMRAACQKEKLEFNFFKSSIHNL